MDKTEVKKQYVDLGDLCKCKAHREGPGPDHAQTCAWYANTRLAKIHLQPEQHWEKGKNAVTVKAVFHFVPWTDLINQESVS